MNEDLGTVRLAARVVGAVVEAGGESLAGAAEAVVVGGGAVLELARMLVAACPAGSLGAGMSCLLVLTGEAGLDDVVGLAVLVLGGDEGGGEEGKGNSELHVVGLCGG